MNPGWELHVYIWTYGNLVKAPKVVHRRRVGAARAPRGSASAVRVSCLIKRPVSVLTDGAAFVGRTGNELIIKAFTL